LNQTRNTVIPHGARPHTGLYPQRTNGSNLSLQHSTAVKSAPTTPAGAGGVVVEFDSRPAPSIDTLHKLLTGERVGVEPPLGIIHGTEKLTVRITPGESVL
jgi:hypothetical protein